MLKSFESGPIFVKASIWSYISRSVKRPERIFLAVSSIFS